MVRAKLFGLAAALAAVLLLSGCGSSKMTPQQKKAQEAKLASLVWEKLDARDFTIDVDYMTPLRGGGRALNSPYSIKVSDDKIVSHLPYVGEARSIPYGGGKGLNFEADIKEYKDSGAQKDRRVIIITVNNGEDTLVYNIAFFDNGKADIHVNSRNRDEIGFLGNIKLDEE